ncbi:MAG: RICIN domain-containing protein, partial [Muribaculaceae bacterium]|nr:RICIN domain-containing protein [Muribaculaceae bacterium]
GLYNAASEHYLGYNCYMDTSAKYKWTFTDAGNGCYTIKNGSSYLAWDAYNVSGGNNDETYVGLTNEFSDNALWKLVTKEDRDNLLDNASKDNPVDATYFIKSPNFNNRESADRHWLFTNSQIFEYGGNHNDYAAESWNTGSFDIHQTIEGLPEGIYELSVQAFYRNGEGSQMVNNDDAQLAVLYVGDHNLGTYQELPVMNINEETHKAPGEGTVFEGNSRTVHVPDNVPQAANFFKSGLYKHTIRVILTNPNNNHQSATRAVSKVTKASLPIGLKQTESGNERDWAVMNNVRLKYYGPETLDTPTGVEDLIDNDSQVISDNKTYNIFGVEVKNPTAPGIYIRNGKKFIIR